MDGKRGVCAPFQVCKCIIQSKGLLCDLTTCFHARFYLIKGRIGKRKKKSTRAKQDLHPVPCWGSSDLPQQRAQGGPAHTASRHTLGFYIFLCLFCSLFPLLFCLFTIPYNFKSWPMDLGRIWSLPFSLMDIISCAVTQTISSASAPGTACCAHSCKKPFPAWYNPSTPPAQSHPGPPRRRESFLWARQGVKPWERLGAEPQLRGRSGFTSKTWVTSSFKGGTVPWSQQFDHLSPGRLTRAALGSATHKREPKCQTWPIPTLTGK